MSHEYFHNYSLPVRMAKFICVHGWRTSGEIMTFQMLSLKDYLNIDCIFIDAPFAATGEPYEVIKTYFPDYPYYEW